MQNAIPGDAETPIVSMIPEVRVYTGQNQIRRNAGFFTQNFQAKEVRTIGRIFAPAEQMTFTAMDTLVLVATDKLTVTFTYMDGATARTATLKSGFLIWDVAITSVTIANTSTAGVQVSLIYTVS